MWSAASIIDTKILLFVGRIYIKSKYQGWLSEGGCTIIDSIVCSG